MKRSKKKSNRELIDDIIDKFDFNGVRRIMVMLNWRWARNDDTPSVGEMRNTARRLLTDICDPSNADADYIATGGFEVRRIEDGLELRFVVYEAAGPINGDGIIKSLIIK
jgi:hypothetical protein